MLYKCVFFNILVDDTHDKDGEREEDDDEEDEDEEDEDEEEDRILHLSERVRDFFLLIWRMFQLPCIVYLHLKSCIVSEETLHPNGPKEARDGPFPAASKLRRHE